MLVGTKVLGKPAASIFSAKYNPGDPNIDFHHYANQKCHTFFLAYHARMLLCIPEMITIITKYVT
jgi:hypothetical protein